MTAIRARLAAAVVIMTAASAVLAGCGSGHSDAAGAGATPTSERPAASAPAIGPDGTAETTAPTATGTTGTTGTTGSTRGSTKGTATESPGEAKASTIPKARLTPATGTFTARQKDYLVGKVPTGMDPAAILQTGQESCDRIANTADSSPELAKEAIRSGEIADAKDAIDYLCPQYKNLL